MAFVAKLDELGKPAWIAMTVLAFAVWWPLGLATLAFAIGSGRMMRGRCGRFGSWQNVDGGWGRGRRRWDASGPGGNRAFAEYRDETLVSDGRLGSLLRHEAGSARMRRETTSLR